MNKNISDFIRRFLMWFAVFYLIAWGYSSFIAPEKNPEKTETSSNITIEVADDDMVLGNIPSWKIKNESDTALTLANPCETPESLIVYRLTNGKRFPISDFSECESKKIPEILVAPQSETPFELKDFNHELFTEAGTYFLEATFAHGEETKTVESDQVEFERPGMLRRLFRGLVSQPLFNLLVTFTNNFPRHSLGWAIVALTVLVRILLFIPNQKSMRSQRELQKLQPKIEELKAKYGKNQQQLAMKTMELYKTHKVNPMSSCLPMLIQIPIMLGVYYIVQDGVALHQTHLLYGFNQAVDLTNVNPWFFGINLENIPRMLFNTQNISETWAYGFLPLFVAGMQWLAIRISFVRAKKKKSQEKKSATNAKPSMANQMQAMSGVMQWMMPIMIGFFAFTFPAAVGIYWLTSTVFGIGQQAFVNWKLDQPQVRKKVS